MRTTPLSWQAFVGRCVGCKVERERRREKGSKHEGEASGFHSAVTTGQKYVEVRAKRSVLIDKTSLEMGQEALKAMKSILLKESQELSSARQSRSDALEEREKAQDLAKQKSLEKDDVMKEVLELNSEIQGVKERLDALHAKLEQERCRQAQLEGESKQIENQKLELEATESRNADLEQEILRAQSVLRTERNTRIRLQAKLKAAIQQSTSHLHQQKEKLHDELCDLDNCIRSEKEEQSELKKKLKHFHQTLEKADADVSETLRSRRAKMETLHDRLMKSDDSPLKAEFRRASQRLQKEKEAVEVLKLQYNIILEEHSSQEKKLRHMKHEKERWKIEEKALREKVDEIANQSNSSCNEVSGRTSRRQHQMQQHSTTKRELFPENESNKD